MLNFALFFSCLPTYDDQFSSLIMEGKSALMKTILLLEKSSSIAILVHFIYSSPMAGCLNHPLLMMGPLVFYPFVCYSYFI